MWSIDNANYNVIMILNVAIFSLCFGYYNFNVDVGLNEDN